LQVAAFAQLAVVGRGSNVRLRHSYLSNEQHICIKFCFEIGKTAMETYQLLQQAYGEDVMACTQVFGSVDLKTEPLLKATPARDDCQH
jgi:hypothetical protein